jgi:antitoxin CcdA
MTRHVADPPKPFRGTPAGRGDRHLGERHGRKRAVNVSLDETLVAEARALGVNLSQTLEDELRKKVQEEQSRRFQEQHRETFEAFNRFIEKHGLWIEEYREW